MTKNNGTHIDEQQRQHEEFVALKDKVADLRVEYVGVQIVHNLTQRIEELIAQRQNYITNANLEINHQVGVYDGQITEIKRVIDMLTPKPPSGASDSDTTPDAKTVTEGVKNELSAPAENQGK